MLGHCHLRDRHVHLTHRRTVATAAIDEKYMHAGELATESARAHSYYSGMRVLKTC